MKQVHFGMLFAAVGAIIAYVLISPLVGVTEGMSLMPTWMWLGLAIGGAVIYLLMDTVGSAIGAVVFMVAALIARGMHQPDWSMWLWVVGFAAFGAIAANLVVSKPPKMVGRH
ncbi:hypothetical protein KJ848_02460 [Patescibacteria group bacterium]|nr:hypothetical protein [Patescibacteria group bacterium]MBU2159019.1 hypothetical protein [Patescibacteria group bacterium]